jgi:DNA-binding MarR family transcriptional regulator
MDKQRDLETIELEMAILVRRVTSNMNNNKIGNLDRAAYLFLHHIYSTGSASVRTLADEFHLDISTVSRQTATLEKKGYIFRTPDPSDKRAFTLQLTELGSRVLNSHKQARLDRVAELLKNWSEEECHLFGKLLKKFNRTVV